jgi:ribosome-associated protein
MKIESDEAGLLLDSVYRGIFEKKGQDVLKIDLRRFENRITDYFIVCHGSSTTQVDSICYSVEEAVRQGTGMKPSHVEGLDNCFWVLIDYGAVIVHIFLSEYRTFYSLESLWADATIEAIKDNI